MNPITKARISQNLTQQQLADRLGVNIRTVQRWEARKGRIPMRIIVVLSVVLSTFSVAQASDVTCTQNGHIISCSDDRHMHNAGKAIANVAGVFLNVITDALCWVFCSEPEVKEDQDQGSAN